MKEGKLKKKQREEEEKNTHILVWLNGGVQKVCKKCESPPFSHTFIFMKAQKRQKQGMRWEHHPPHPSDFRTGVLFFFFVIMIPTCVA